VSLTRSCTNYSLSYSCSIVHIRASLVHFDTQAATRFWAFYAFAIWVHDVIYDIDHISSLYQQGISIYKLPSTSYVLWPKWS
jgi:hypothetical protein